MVAAVRMAHVQEDTAPTEKMALERAVTALTILSKWQSGRSKGSGRPRGSRSGGQCKMSL